MNREICGQCGTPLGLADQVAAVRAERSRMHESLLIERGKLEKADDEIERLRKLIDIAAWNQEYLETLAARLDEAVALLGRWVRWYEHPGHGPVDTNVLSDSHDFLPRAAGSAEPKETGATHA